MRLAIDKFIRSGLFESANKQLAAGGVAAVQLGRLFVVFIKIVNKTAVQIGEHGLNETRPILWIQIIQPECLLYFKTKLLKSSSQN